MRNSHKDLPPLDYLIAFDAAATLGGFTAAADSLNVSQAAVSRKIRLLEQNLGKELFVRGHRSVTLTPEGKAYLRSVSKLLDQLAAASRELRSADHPARVTIAATNSISTLWLMPRIQDFRESYPEIEIQLISSDDDEACLSGDVDLAILRGEGEWEGFESERLLDEEVYPVCSRSYRGGTQALTHPEELSGQTLIDVASHHEEWLDWRSWFAATGAALPPDVQYLRVNTYPLAIQAACDGLGIALGWRHLVDGQLKQGKLMRLLKQSVRTESGYYLLTPRNRPGNPDRDSFAQWLISRA